MRRKIFTVIFTRCKCPSYRWISPENYPYYGENTLSKKKLQLRENYGSYPSILQCAPRVLAHTLVDNLVYELSVCCRMTIYHKWSLKTSITWIIDEVRHFERPLLYYLRWKDGTNFEPMSKLFSTKVFSDFWYFVLCMFYDPFSKILGCNSIPYLRDGKRAYYLVRSPMKFWKIDTCNWHTELAFT